MATLYKHGAVLAEIVQLTKKKAYMADGVILVNYGDGWKKYGRVKPGVDIADHAKRQAERYAKFLSDNPHVDALRKLLHSEITFSQRFAVNEVLNVLANDPDGVWSELNDMLNIPIDIDSVVELCRLHDLAAAEAKERRQNATNSTANTPTSPLIQ